MTHAEIAASSGRSLEVVSARINRASPRAGDDITDLIDAPVRGPRYKYRGAPMSERKIAAESGRPVHIVFGRLRRAKLEPGADCTELIDRPVRGKSPRVTAQPKISSVKKYTYDGVDLKISEIAQIIGESWHFVWRRIIKSGAEIGSDVTGLFERQRNGKNR